MIINLDDIKDFSIRMTDVLVENGFIKNCTDSDDQDECEVQDLIREELCKTLNIKNE